MNNHNDKPRKWFTQKRKSDITSPNDIKDTEMKVKLR